MHQCLCEHRNACEEALGSSSLNLCFPVSSLLRWQWIFQHQEVTFCPLSVSVEHSWQVFLLIFKGKKSWNTSALSGVSGLWPWAPTPHAGAGALRYYGAVSSCRLLPWGLGVLVCLSSSPTTSLPLHRAHGAFAGSRGSSHEIVFSSDQKRVQPPLSSRLTCISIETVIRLWGFSMLALSPYSLSTHTEMWALQDPVT